MTRAKDHLYLIRAFRRAFSGHNPPSRFLADIPADLTNQHERLAKPALFSQRHRYDAVSTSRLTDADAASSSDGPSAATETFAAGDHVCHPKFGEGIVVSCDPSGSDYQVVVAFRGEAGIKKLLLSYAHLERLEV
jgi:DNA helicase-2/ATP-dependent DNA helicase PcrA